MQKRMLSIIVIVLLIMNFITFIKLGDLNNQIENLKYGQNQIQSSIGGISGNVNNTLNRFTREQTWITQVQANEGKTKIEDEKITAVLNWQIKEYQKGAEVVFNYRQRDTEEFIAIPAESIGDGLFEVVIPFEVEVEPFWEIGVSHSSEKNSITEEVVDKGQKPSGINYYISMSMNDSVKSSEVSHFSPNYLVRTKYEPIMGHIDIRDNWVDISLFQHSPQGNEYDSAWFKVYDGNKLLAEQILEEEEGPGRTQYFANYQEELGNITRLVLYVKYQDGKIFEKEIFK